MSRIESPSSINTYKQCPRKYYYHYIKELPTKPSIHLIRGNILHLVLEYFFDVDVSISSEDSLRLHLFSIFEKQWVKHYPKLLELDMDDKELKNYYDDSKNMLKNWFGRFRKKLQNQIEQGKTFSESFEHLTPGREEEFCSKEHDVRGFIDAVHRVEDNVVILDYKTSKKAVITPEYRLQLGIYALMYQENHGELPQFVGIDFLKFSEQVVPVDERLVEDAKKDIQYVHSKTISKEINDYPKKTSPLCKWRSGQCDYYELCFERNNSLD